MLDKLKKIDFFYSPVKIKFKNQEYFTSALGGAFTIIVTCISLILLITTGKDIFNKSKCSSCALNYYLSNNSCIACNSKCSTCTGTSESNCLTCADFYYMSNGIC